ncbi:hypothetical protein Tco_1076481 [Tanacetum coccineum]
MNPQETEQVVARDELWVPTAERVNISITNVRLETTAFTISVDVPEILMQQFWYTITKIKDFKSYEFLLADKKCVIDAEVFRKILDICPRKEGGRLTEDTLDIPPLILDTHCPFTNIINVCGPHASALEDSGSLHQQVREKKSRRENMPYPRFTKVIIDYFLSKHKSLKKLKFQHFHTIKDDGVNHTRCHPVFLLVKIPSKESKRKRFTRKKTTIPTEEFGLMCQMSLTKPLIKRKTLVEKEFLTEAEEEDAARQVRATHARIVSESVPEPARRRRSDIAIFETTQKLKGIQTLTPDEQEAADNGSDEGTVKINVRKNADTEMKDAEKTADITKETTEQPLTSSSFSLCLLIISSKKLRISENSPEEIIIIKREQEEKKQEPTIYNKSTDKAALEEFDLKRPLFKFMHNNKSANRNPANKNYIMLSWNNDRG